jgi:GNAT superfamily N-acetyltransferase
MNIQQATEENLSQIVYLLKQSLGESLLQKSEMYWRWKHINNPFGKSPVLIAVEDDQIIGVRAFMRWQWSNNARVLNAVRAVDTATHPDHQGKGIFTKLTRACLQNCEAEKIDFVFNTPNNKSKPGYLKMGWVEAGRLPIHLNIPTPLRLPLHALFPENEINENSQDDLNYFFRNARLQNLLSYQAGEQLQTNLSLPYLRWRYLEVPVAKYFGFGLPNNSDYDCLVIYRLKNSKFGTELRITDVIGAKELLYGSAMRKSLKLRARNHRISFVTMAAFDRSPFAFPTTRKLQKGPIVTVKEISASTAGLINFQAWEPSIGDMELF